MSVLAFLVQTLRIATPYLFAASGGVLSERAGVIALTLEGWMLTGAFCAAIGSYFAHSPWVGVACGLAGGRARGPTARAGEHPLPCGSGGVGIAANLLAIGVTRFFLRLAFDSSSNSPRIPGFDWSVTTGGGSTASAGGAGVILSSLANPLVILGILVAARCVVACYRGHRSGCGCARRARSPRRRSRLAWRWTRVPVARGRPGRGARPPWGQHTWHSISISSRTA